MSTFNVTLPFIYFADPARGRPVFNGSIYVGEPDRDPELFPIQLFIQNQNGSISAVTQPVMTGAGGVPMVNGSPAQLVVQANYSMRVRDNLGAQIYYVANGLANSGGGGGGTGDFVPRAGTAAGLPITGRFTYQTVGINNVYESGIFGQPFNGYWIADAQRVPTSRFGVQMNSNLWIFEGATGALLLGTDFSTPGLSTASAASMQYVLDQIGSPLGNFIPLAGTAPGKPVTGPIQFDESTLGIQATIGILTGFTDELTISTNGPILVATGSDPATQWWAFQTNGQMILPNIDYSAANPLAAVTKAYVDAQGGGGGGGAFIPLAGTVPGQEVTGLIKFRNATLNQEWQLGITNVPGLWQNMSISNGGSGALPTSFAIIVNGKFNIFDSDGKASFDQVYAQDINNQGGYIGALGALFGGDVTCNTDLDVNGTTTMQGLFCGQIIALNASITGAQGAGGGALTRRDFVTGLDAANVKLTGNQTIAGDKNFSGTTGMQGLFSGQIIATNAAISGAQGTAGGDLTRRDFVTGLDSANVKLTGNQTIAGIKTFTGTITPSNINANNLPTSTSRFVLSYDGSGAVYRGPIVAPAAALDAAVADLTVAQTAIITARERIESLEAERNAFIQRFEALEARVLALEP